jgi:hypothetical protein
MNSHKRTHGKRYLAFVLAGSTSFFSSSCGAFKKSGSSSGQNKDLGELAADPRTALFLSGLQVIDRTVGTSDRSIFSLGTDIDSEDDPALRSLRRTNATGNLLRDLTITVNGKIETRTQREFKVATALAFAESDPDSAALLADEPEWTTIETTKRDDSDRVVETIKERISASGSEKETETLEYSNANFPNLRTKVTKVTERAGKSPSTEIETYSYDDSGNRTKGSTSENGEVTKEEISTCESLTCTEIKYSRRPGEELKEDSRKVTKYFGAVAGLIEREEVTKDSKKMVRQATFADNRFTGYEVSGEERSGFWGRQGTLDFSVTGSCKISENRKIECTTTKTSPQDLTVTDVQSATYFILRVPEIKGSKNPTSILLPFPNFWSSNWIDKGESKNHLVMKTTLDDQFRPVKMEGILGGNTETEYNGPIGKKSKQTKSKSDGSGTIEHIDEFTYGADGRLAKTTRFNPDKTVQYTEEYTYAP